MSRVLRRHYGTAAGRAVRDVVVAPHEGRLRAVLDGVETHFDARVLQALPQGARLALTWHGGRATAVAVRDGDTVHVALRGRVHRLSVVAQRRAESAAAELCDPFAASPMTGVVRAVRASPGESVPAGATLFVVEAMKMEFSVDAPRDVTVDEVRAAPGDRVEIGQVVVTFRAEPAA